MRYPAGHKQSTHERILAAGGALLRSAGVEGASVGRVMSRAGLTVGGFYAHFASKRALVGEALRWVLRRKRSDWLRDLEALRGPAFLEAFVRRYLSRQHRDLAGQGCPLPAVLSELPRAGAACPGRERLSGGVRAAAGAGDARALLRGHGARARGAGPRALRRDPARLPQVRARPRRRAFREREGSIELNHLRAHARVVRKGAFRGR